MRYRDNLSAAALLCAAGALVAALPAGAAVDPAPAASRIRELPGRWTGDGMVELRNGKRLPYKCVVTYFLEERETRLRQNVRCKHESEHRIDLGAEFRVSGERLAGTWEERLTSLRGAAQGRMTADGFEVLASHSHFQARFEIAMADRCHQTVRITPSREVRQITARLRKC